MAAYPGDMRKRKYRLSPIRVKYVMEGRLGRKSSKVFYTYHDKRGM